MDTVDIIGLLAPVSYFVFLITEKLWPARKFPPRAGWQWIGIGFLILISTISVVVPLLIPEEWLAAHRWFDGTKLGVVGGTIVGFESTDQAWRLAVSDDGVGIGSRLADAPARFGLGTSIVEALTRQLGGRVTTSAASPGTTVSVTVPRSV